MSDIVISLVDLTAAGPNETPTYMVGIKFDCTRAIPEEPTDRSPAENIATALMQLLYDEQWLLQASGASTITPAPRPPAVH